MTNQYPGDHQPTQAYSQPSQTPEAWNRPDYVENDPYPDHYGQTGQADPLNGDAPVTRYDQAEAENAQLRNKLNSRKSVILGLSALLAIALLSLVLLLTVGREPAPKVSTDGRTTTVTQTQVEEQTATETATETSEVTRTETETATKTETATETTTVTAKPENSTDQEN